MAYYDRDCALTVLRLSAQETSTVSILVNAVLVHNIQAEQNPNEVTDAFCCWNATHNDGTAELRVSPLRVFNAGVPTVSRALFTLQDRPFCGFPQRMEGSRRGRVPSLWLGTAKAHASRARSRESPPEANFEGEFMR